MSKKLFWPILIIGSAMFASLFGWSNSGGIVRSGILFWFIMICPGMAVTGLLHLKGFLSELVLAIALSLVISTLIAEVMVLSHLWSPPTELAVLIIISLVGATLQIRNALQPKMILR